MSSRITKNLVIAIYFHPEAYPPTLNAIGELSDCFDNLSIIHRPHLKGSWVYPPNVQAIPSGKYISSINQEKSPLQKKIRFFFEFTRSLLRECRCKKPVVILVYDNLSLFAYHLIRPLLHNHKIWYHNHDVTEPGVLRKFSIGWFAARKELKAFKYLDIFSLPTNERLQYFPMDNFKGKYFFIPNYPSKYFYASFYKIKTIGEPLRLIFQGSIGPYHGIEEIIPLLKESIDGYGLELILKGPCRDEYKQLCTDLAEKHGVRKKVFFLGVTPYAEVPLAGSTCHIGIGILAKNDIMNTTLGTASNKLYEYAAVGLPVIYYNRPNFTQFLSKYIWALPTELDTIEIKKKISLIIRSYEQLSFAAHEDFMQHLNYETGFVKIKSYIRNLLDVLA
ncbi:MAG: glycosyltransferase [Chitinophagaceae bacterium]